ncbi:MAG: cadmium-translocating P-type ATPase [Deltaproteobacteria bacterium]|nr:cadmium-translocating P-type ATPase [Deltaproteobacteria bacterium]
MSAEHHQKVTEVKWYTHPPLRNALVAGVCTGLAFVLGYTGVIPFSVEVAAYVGAILLGGYHWCREGLEELVHERVVGIEILMVTATVGSTVLGMWDEAATLVVLYGAAEGLEEFTYARTRHSIRKLLDLAPKEARVRRQGREQTIPAEDLRPGDIFIVRPGEAVPTDGVIVKGRSSVNEAPVTGESLPVEKREGMRVFAASLNQEGALEVRATAVFEDNTLSKLIHLVEEAQEQKGKAQLFIERFGRRYSPVVLLTSLLMVAVPWLLGLPMAAWATRAVVLLVAAAPCALVMSMPVAIAAGIGRAGQNGVLIKGGMVLENLGKIRAVAFDKTGTLTQGKPQVQDIIPLDGNVAQLLCLAASVERLSEHPLAQAIVQRAAQEGYECLEISEFTAIAGYGAQARVGDRLVYVGKPGLFKRFGFDIPSLLPQAHLTAAGTTVMLVGTETSLAGVITLRDEIRPQAREIIARLHRLGLKTVMLTGDNEATARAVGKLLDIDEIRADLRPEDKIDAVEDLKRRYGPVVMVGDGINDAPALARATVGVAMGTAGTDAAIEAADIALMADDLTKLEFALQLGRKARRISFQNIVFSLTVLAVLIPAALAGLLGVALAVLCHEASELLAVANGLRVART